MGLESPGVREKGHWDLPQPPRATSTLLHHAWSLPIPLKCLEKTLGPSE